MKRGMIVLVLSLIFAVFLVGVVGAQTTNWAASANGGVATLSDGSTPAGIENINDENDGTYYSVSHTDCDCWATFTAQIMFAETASEITQIDYNILLQEGGNEGEYEYSDIYVLQSGSWNHVGTVGGGSGSLIGNWQNVEGVRAYLAALGSMSVCPPTVCTSTATLYELKAWGPEPTPPTHSCASPDDIIMKLYQSNNSHGAVWDDTNGYNWEICYNDIFVEAWGGTIYHPSSCSSPVLWLSDTYNSHASTTQDSTYNIPVCYGDLTCEADTSAGTGCTNGGEVVIRLYQDTNSHISDASDTNYGIKICCLSGVEITGANWADMRGTILTAPNNQVNLSDRVKLMVAGEGMLDREIIYTIYKGVAFWFDDEVAQTATTGFTTWRASEEGTYYFTAEIQGITGTRQSGDLVVLDTEDNSAPVADITSPNTGDIYLLNEVIDFTQLSYDVDDEITTSWDFGDGSPASSVYDTTHSYTSKGQKIITLTVTDERGLVATDRGSVLIINVGVGADAKYVFAHIDEPEWGQSIDGRVVSFDASSSYSIETTLCNDLTCTIDCLGGGCPLTTQGAVPITINDNIKRGVYSDLEFTWNFDDGSWKNDMGDAGRIFDWTFRAAGEHTALLNVSINPFSLTQVEFVNFFTVPYCYRDKTTDNTFWYEDWNIIPSWDGECYREDGEPTTDCCPPGYACDSGTGDCVELQGIVSCSQYNEQECGGNVFPAEDDLDPLLVRDDGKKCGGSKEYGANCWEIIECRCEWDDIDGIDGECDSVAEQLVCDATQCWDKTTGIPSDIETTCAATGLPFGGECSFDFTHVDKCDDEGVIGRSWTVNWEQTPISFGTAPLYCEGGEDTIDCKMAKLGFWGIAGLVVAILLIIIIYWFIIRKGKKRERK